MEKTAGYKENRLTILLISLAGMTVYLLPFFRYYYYDAFLLYFNINDMQMGILGSVYGAVSIVGYCLGGWVADRFSLKFLLPGSLIATGAFGFVMLLKPGYTVLVIIFAIWGATSILTFWNPMMKVLRVLCHADEQARGFALFDMGRGILNFGSGIAIMAAYTAISKKIGEMGGLTALIVFYSAWTVLIGIVVYFALKDRMPDFKKEAGAKDANFVKNVIAAMKMPTTWCLVVIIFTTYAVIISYYYVVPYCTAAFGMSAALAGIMGYAANGFRLVGCAIGGQFSDRKGLSTGMMVDILLMAVGVIGLLVMPAKMSLMWLLIIFVGILCMSMYSAQALHFAIMEEGSYPVETMGAAMLICTPLGYSAESIMPLFSGWCLSAFEGTKGYQVLFTGFLVLLAIGFTAVLIWRKCTKEHRLELDALRKQKTK